MIGAMDVDQHCVGCGRPTAAGHSRFADRRAVENADGTRSYLCGMCGATAAANRGKEQLSDQELRQLIENGSAAGVLWSGGGLGVGL